MARKDPRLHVRFKDHAELDKIEIWANQRGEKLGAWVYKAINKQAKLETANDRIATAAYFSVLEAVAILRELAGPEISKTARSTVDEYVDAVKAEVANDFN